MEAAIWYLIIGVLFFIMALGASFVRSLPLTSAVVYLVVGLIMGPIGISLLQVDPVEGSSWMEILTEAVVIISLFAAGLKLRLPLHDQRWRPAVRLAFLSMAINVGLITVFCVWVLDMPVGVAVLLGAILSPTDPVLATDVQVRGPEDADKLRFFVTCEAGLNDGTAFPFVMLGLGLMGLHDIGEFGWRWLAVDLVWAVASGIILGFGIGTFAAKYVDRFRTKFMQKKQDVIILDSFLALGVIALSYGLSLVIHGYGFLAVFAAGLAIRRVERLKSGDKVPDVGKASLSAPEEIKPGPHSKNTPAVLAKAALDFDEELERIGEVAAVILVGSMLSFSIIKTWDFLLIPFLILIVRPLSVWLGLMGSRGVKGGQKLYISWFGIRGIGSVYYLMYAIQHGIPADMGERLAQITMAAIAISILAHGISVTPLMKNYQKKFEPT